MWVLSVLDIHGLDLSEGLREQLEFSGYLSLPSTPAGRAIATARSELLRASS